MSGAFIVPAAWNGQRISALACMLQPNSTVVFAGGVALGAYQAGAWQALQDDPGCQVGWIAGSSVGAINGALLAGNPRDLRLAALESYWLSGSAWPSPTLLPSGAGSLRHAANWMSVLTGRLLGSPRHLQTAVAGLSFASFYDLSPTAAFLRRHVDWGRLNGGDIRLTVCATDIESGEAAIFDTARGDRITLDHLLASCGFLPEFAPVEIDGRLLGDGALIANAPIEPVLDEVEGSAATVFVVDLFARDGRRPTGLESALARKNALLFGNQTAARLDLYRRLWQRLGRAPHPTILHLSYQPVPGEAGAEMMFDFSQASAGDRWSAGCLDAREALRLAAQPASARDIVTAVRR